MLPLPNPGGGGVGGWRGVAVGCGGGGWSFQFPRFLDLEFQRYGSTLLLFISIFLVEFYTFLEIYTL